jgi:hypothetical protein
VQFEDGAVDPCGQPKIIGIDNQTAHTQSLSTPATIHFSTSAAKDFVCGIHQIAVAANSLL